MSDQFIDRLYKGLVEYFKGNVIISVDLDKSENRNGVIRFVDKRDDHEANQAPAPWSKLTLFCTSEAGNKSTVRAAFPRPQSIGHMCWPKLNSCTFSVDTSVSDRTIANRVMREIIEPAREPMAEYLARIEAQKAEEQALPAIVAKYREMGFNVRTSDRPGSTEASFYLSRTALDNHIDLSVSGTIHANGRVQIDRAYLNAENGEQLMKFLQEMK